jgi:hypothetical protein
MNGNEPIIEQITGNGSIILVVGVLGHLAKKIKIYDNAHDDTPLEFDKPFLFDIDSPFSIFLWLQSYGIEPEEDAFCILKKDGVLEIYLDTTTEA